MASSPLQHLERYFLGSELRESVAALACYYGPQHPYTGAAFDELIATTHPGTYTAQDIVAVSMLSVNVPPAAALNLMSGAADELLAVIPSGSTLWNNSELLDPHGKGWELWGLVDGFKGVGRTTTSKILAAKRPALFPVYDQHVANALELNDNYWAFWQVAASDPHVTGLLESVEQARRSADVPECVTALRLIDVVVWMRHHGWKSHPDRCSECNVESFKIT